MIKKLFVVMVIASGLMLTPTANAGSPASSIKFPCKQAGVATLDPIVVPDGGPSAHEHVFTGNLGVPKGVHDYDTAIQQGTTCTKEGDTAAYWTPTARKADGSLIPAKMIVYYDCMVKPCQVFPKDFGMVTKMLTQQFSSKQRSYGGWNCDNADPLQPTWEGLQCPGGSQVVTLRIFFPYCWDGVTPETRNYSAHMFYPTGYPTVQKCDAGQIELPRIRLNSNFQVTSMPPGTVFSSDAMNGTSGGRSAHADFWNTWQQPALEALVAQLNV